MYHIPQYIYHIYTIFSPFFLSSTFLYTFLPPPPESPLPIKPFFDDSGGFSSQHFLLFPAAFLVACWIHFPRGGGEVAKKDIALAPISHQSNE